MKKVVVGVNKLLVANFSLEFFNELRSIDHVKCLMEVSKEQVAFRSVSVRNSPAALISLHLFQFPHDVNHICDIIGAGTAFDETSLIAM